MDLDDPTVKSRSDFDPLLRVDDSLVREVFDRYEARNPVVKPDLRQKLHTPLHKAERSLLN